MSENKLVIFFDGASRGNPGHSGVGAIVFNQGKIFSILSKYIGVGTNNAAEYRSLKEILMKIGPVVKKKKETGVLLRTDSELLAKQLTGEYKIKNARLRILSNSVIKMLSYYRDWDIVNIPREENKIADALATAAVDNALRGLKKR